jgi:hypothetical protein
MGAVGAGVGAVQAEIPQKAINASINEPFANNERDSDTIFKNRCMIESFKNETTW